MDLIVKRELAGIELWMPLHEALAFLRDPKRAQREVRQALAASGVDPDTGKWLAERTPMRVRARVAKRRGADVTDRWDEPSAEHRASARRGAATTLARRKARGK